MENIEIFDEAVSGYWDTLYQAFPVRIELSTSIPELDEATRRLSWSLVEPGDEDDRTYDNLGRLLVPSEEVAARLEAKKEELTRLKKLIEIRSEAAHWLSQSGLISVSKFEKQKIPLQVTLSRENAPPDQRDTKKFGEVKYLKLIDARLTAVCLEALRKVPESLAPGEARASLGQQLHGAVSETAIDVRKATMTSIVGEVIGHTSAAVMRSFAGG